MLRSRLKTAFSNKVFSAYFDVNNFKEVTGQKADFNRLRRKHKVRREKKLL